MISCRSLSCGYPGRTVLEDVSFRLAPGEILALLGPNGSGKSTLLKTLMGTLNPLAGEVEIEGASLQTMAPRLIAQKVAYVPQEEGVAFPFTARQIVLMGRWAKSPGLLDSPDDHNRVDRAMERAGCMEVAERPITELSGGERQRLRIARALAAETDVLLFDEPTSNLDAAHVASFVALTRTLATEGKAILIAVHDMNVAAALGDRAMLLGPGQVQDLGTVADVLTGPKLEQVYGIEFERFRQGPGLRLFPDLK